MAIVWKANKLFSRSCAVCNSHSFGGPQVLQILLFRIKAFCSFLRSFYHCAHCLFPIVLSGSQDFVRFLRPMAHQSGGITHCVHMILKVAYWYGLLFVLLMTNRTLNLLTRMRARFSSKLARINLFTIIWFFLHDFNHASFSYTLLVLISDYF